MQGTITFYITLNMLPLFFGSWNYALGLLSTSTNIMGFLNSYLATFTALASLSIAGNTTVTLPGYGSFAGTTISRYLTNRLLPAPVDAWLDIDYASQPVGQSRFAQVGRPTPFSGVKDASAYGFSCVQDPSMISYPQSEACLNMNVFRPQTVAPNAKLPVFIWIHGVRQY
jgi:acetylcholinesterase